MSDIPSNNIERARVLRGYTQEQVAGALGISRPTYSNIESGKKELTINQIKALSTMLCIGIEDILGTNGEDSIFFNAIASTEKYKQIILNTLQHGADSDEKITKTKLAKLVYLADFIWFYRNSSPMSGMTYRKLPQGPVSDVYFRALDEMEDAGIVIREPKGKAIMYSLVEKEVPTNRLSEQELELIKGICHGWRGKPTAEIVDFTHQQLPWQICREGEAIPYSLITQEKPENVYGSVKL